MIRPVRKVVYTFPPLFLTLENIPLHPVTRKADTFLLLLKYRYLERLVIKKNKVVEREKVLENIGRVRDVREGPDGYLYIAVEGKGILKIIEKK